MNAWIIYNGALRINRMELIAKRLSEKAKLRNLNLILIKNNEIIPYYNENSKADLKSCRELLYPKFIIFWDKDIMLAKHLEVMGFKVFNSSKNIEICDNKSLTHINLANCNIRVPRTILAPFTFSNQDLSNEYIDMLFNELGNKLIVKESHGSFGMQVNLVNNKKEFLEVLKKINNKLFIVQEYIDTSYGTDVRVNLIGNKIIGSIKRNSSCDFRSNITLGGTGKVYNLNKEQEELALKVQKILGLDFCGLDILFGKNNEAILCEVNSNLSFLSFEEITGIDFSGMLIDYLIERSK
jgi:RimK family alpha-L-glutamate ligase